MKIGILTLFSEYNYGSVLQAFALMNILRDEGHDVSFIDRHITPNNIRLYWILANHSPAIWLAFLVRGLLGFGDFPRLLRHIKSIKLIKRLFPTTAYHFDNWPEAPSHLDFDLIIVGSDQVWSPINPSPYLLIDAPPCHAIAYGASIGAYELSASLLPIYKKGLSRFAAISVREKNGVRLLRKIGFSATRVVDPTILVEQKFWEGFVTQENSKRKKLVLYLFDVNILDIWKDLVSFSVLRQCEVEIFLDKLPDVTLHNLSSIERFYKFKLGIIAHRIHLRLSADSFDFLKTIAHANYIITDSFHGFLFSVIFKRNVRILRPHTPERQIMFARLSETVSEYSSKEIIKDNVRDALDSLHSSDSLFDDDVIKHQRNDSLIWLRNAIKAK